MALGAENRKETLLFTADAVAIQNGTNNSDGEIAVWEGFGEIEVPILQDKPFAHTLTLNGGLRYSSYTNNQPSSSTRTAYRVWTYKGELAWAPMDDLRLRTSYNRAIRAPNIGELFAARQVGNVALDDPCAGATPAASAAQCARNRRYAGPVWLDHPVSGGYLLVAGRRQSRAEAGNRRHGHRGHGADPAPDPQFLLLGRLLPYQGEGLHRLLRSLADRLAMHQHGRSVLLRPVPSRSAIGAIFGSNAAGGYLIATTLNTGYLKTDGIDFNADYTRALGRFGRLNVNVMGTLLLSQ
jgi:hypothetical protein